jgi:hypothetical protein
MEDNIWDEQVSEISKIVDEEESQYIELGKRVSFLAQSYGSGFLRKPIYERLLNDIEKMTGRKPSYSKLRQAKQVYEKVQQYNIPPDIPYYAILAITGSDRVDEWVDCIHEGIAYGEILKRIKESRGKKTKVATCPDCGKEFVL